MKGRKAMKTKVTAELFAVCKIMIKGGAKINEVADFLKIGHATVSRIKAAETFEEYQQIQAAYWCKTKQKEKAKKLAEEQEKKIVQEQIVIPETTEPEKEPVKEKHDPVVSNYQLNRMIERQEQMIELLKLISNKMAFIVEQLL